MTDTGPIPAEPSEATSAPRPIARLEPQPDWDAHGPPVYPDETRIVVMVSRVASEILGCLDCGASLQRPMQALEELIAAVEHDVNMGRVETVRERLEQIAWRGSLLL